MLRGGAKRKKSKPPWRQGWLQPAPSMYSLSLVKNIVPKVEYLARLWGGDDRTEDVTECRGRRNSLLDNLRKYPVILTLSLEDNIVPTLLFFDVMG
jgi:hypothetical protein